METMYDKLLQLPFFQGMTHDDFTEIVGKTKLEFARHDRKSVLAQAGDPCRKLIFLLSGELSAQASAADESYILTEIYNTPCVLEPQAMFGLNSSFSHTYTAETNVQVVSIDKRYVMHTLWKYDIFRINLMNIMCSRAQRQRNYLCRPLPDGLAARIIDFIERRCEIPTGYKSLKIKMEELARNIHETRLNVSKTLNRWESLELIELKRGEIIIFDLDILRHEVL